MVVIHHPFSALPRKNMIKLTLMPQNAYLWSVPHDLLNM
jgi:hypothetical protein